MVDTMHLIQNRILAKDMMKDVVVQNLCQVCVFKVAKEHKKPWLWWDYVTDSVPNEGKEVHEGVC